MAAENDRAPQALHESDTESDEVELNPTGAADEPSDDESDHEDQEDEGDEDDEGEGERILNVRFTFHDPQEIDYLSVKRLVLPLLPGQESDFDASGLADAIISQKAAGTMVKVDDDVDVWAMATVLPLDLYRDRPFTKQIIDFLTTRCPGAHRSALRSLLSGSEGRVSLLVSERMLNFPPELAPAIFGSLLEDLDWAQEHEVTDARRAAFAADHYILLAPCYSEQEQERTGTATATASSSSKGRLASTQRAKHDDHDDDDDEPWGRDRQPQDGVWYMHFEDELLTASAPFTFDVVAPVSASFATSAVDSEATTATQRPAVPDHHDDDHHDDHHDHDHDSSAAPTTTLAERARQQRTKRARATAADDGGARSKRAADIPSSQAQAQHATSDAPPPLRRNIRRCCIFPAEALEAAVEGMTEMVAQARRQART